MHAPMVRCKSHARDGEAWSRQVGHTGGFITLTDPNKQFGDLTRLFVSNPQQRSIPPHQEMIHSRLIPVGVVTWFIPACRAIAFQWPQLPWAAHLHYSGRSFVSRNKFSNLRKSACFIVFRKRERWLLCCHRQKIMVFEMVLFYTFFRNGYHAS